MFENHLLFFCFFPLDESNFDPFTRLNLLSEGLYQNQSLHKAGTSPDGQSDKVEGESRRKAWQEGFGHNEPIAVSNSFSAIIRVQS